MVLTSKLLYAVLMKMQANGVLTFFGIDLICTNLTLNCPNGVQLRLLDDDREHGTVLLQ